MKRHLSAFAVLALALAAQPPARADYVLGVTVVADPHGVKVVGIIAPSAARDIGIKVGDVIRTCNNTNVFSAFDLQQAVQASGPVPVDGESPYPNPYPPDAGLIDLWIHRGDGSDWKPYAVLTNQFEGGALARGATRALSARPPPRR